MRRRALALLVLVGGPALLRSRRRRAAARARVSLYYDDGSMVTLESGAPRAERLIELARGAL